VEEVQLSLVLCQLPLRPDKVFQKFPVKQPTEWPPLAAASCLICKNKEESAKISAKVNQAVEVELPGLSSREWGEF
jgi:hypothetical protein